MTETHSLSTRFTASLARIRTRIATTRLVARGVVRQPGPLAVLLAVTVAYLGTFLWVLGDIVVSSGAGLSVFVADNPLSRTFRPAPGAFLFQPVALLELGVLVWEFSPINTLLGLAIASLVGLNLAFSYLAVTQPRSCGLSTSAGVFASIPGLLAGSTCCAPVILLVFGIQASGILLTAFVWLLPASIALLLSTLVYVAGKVDPTAL
ncbi:hypothetical protein [Salinibaculum salinum]|uniref:hypothetical protein n=1 Tax=Salinibaculum salinum TaxID=3131996 RepID=UPI0030EF8582